MKKTVTTTALAVVLLGALAACNTDKPKAASTPTASHASASSSPTKAAKTTAPAKAGATATPAAKKPATAQARKQAAVILEQEDQDFRDFLAQGEKAVGTPQWPAWNQKAIVGLDMKQTAFSKADALFTADNEPADLLEQWREDNGEADSGITRFANDTGPELTAASRKDASDVLTLLEKADKDAEKIANGS